MFAGFLLLNVTCKVTAVMFLIFSILFRTVVSTSLEGTIDPSFPLSLRPLAAVDSAPSAESMKASGKSQDK